MTEIRHGPFLKICGEQERRWNQAFDEIINIVHNVAEIDKTMDYINFLQFVVLRSIIELTIDDPQAKLSAAESFAEGVTMTVRAKVDGSLPKDDEPYGLA